LSRSCILLARSLITWACLKKPFSMTKGGYVIVSDGGKVDEVFGSLGQRAPF
jgi:hypothetical protein